MSPFVGGGEVDFEPPQENGRKKPKYEYPSRSCQFLERLKASQEEALASPPFSMNVVVVGAGLGGLATAIALAISGHRVKILEQAAALKEVGAGIQIPPNSSRLLESWGVGKFFENRVVEPEAMIFRRWENGGEIGRTQLIPNFKETFGAPYYVIHRADFHASMCARAQELGVEILTKSKVVSYNAEHPLVETEDGRKFTGDLIIAADGVKSLARKDVLRGQDIPPEYTGFAVYRATVKVDRMEKDPETKWLLENPSINAWIGPDRHVMTYCISGGDSFNLVLSHRDRSDPATWKPERAVQDMVDQFQGWDPVLVKIIRMIESTIKWPLFGGAVLPTWTAKTNKLIILGDAAHAMVPYMSQGAAMAVEDAAGLAKSLSNVRAREDIPKALKIFEEVRMNRSYGMQAASMVNGRLWHFEDGPEQKARDKGMEAEVSGKPFLESTNQWSDPVTQRWAYGYDAEAEVQNRWLET